MFNILLLFIGDLKMMVWPAQSPDLNPIEGIWDLLKIKLEKQRGKTSIKQLWTDVQTHWNSIGPSVLKRYIYTMRRRLKAVIRNKGGHTEY